MRVIERKVKKSTTDGRICYKKTKLEDRKCSRISVTFIIFTNRDMRMPK